MTAQSPSLALLPIGSIFHGRYLITRGLGAGAMGAVHEVRDQNTNHRCALKVMLPGVVENDDLRARLSHLHYGQATLLLVMVTEPAVIDCHTATLDSAATSNKLRDWFPTTYT